MVTLEDVKRWVAGWANSMFWPRAHFLSYWSGTAGSNRPIRTNSSGYVDPSFYDLSDPTITVQDDNFTIVDDGDNTKAVQFQLSGITTATTRTITVPDANFTLMGVAVAQSPQNKTYDSTNISGLTAKNPPVNADSVVIVDSAASNVFKRVTYTNIKAFLKTYFDTLYNLYVHPNHSGDVTSAGDGATTIANAAVSNAKLANMAQATIKGRASGAGTGDPVDLSVSQVVAILGSNLTANNIDAPTDAEGQFGSSGGTYRFPTKVYMNDDLDVAGEIIDPTITDFTNAAHNHTSNTEGGTLSTQYSIADDAVASFAGVYGTLIINTNQDANVCGTFAIRSGAGPFINGYAKGSLVDTSTSTLTGTTGTNGRFTVSASNSSTIYLENRTGSTLTVRAIWLP